MSKGDQTLLAFNRGVVARSSLGRLDLKRLALSAEEQTNFLPRSFGPMSVRPGLKFLGALSGAPATFSCPIGVYGPPAEGGSFELPSATVEIDQAWALNTFPDNVGEITGATFTITLDWSVANNGALGHLTKISFYVWAHPLILADALGGALLPPLNAGAAYTIRRAELTSPTVPLVVDTETITYEVPADRLNELISVSGASTGELTLYVGTVTVHFGTPGEDTPTTTAGFSGSITYTGTGWAGDYLASLTPITPLPAAPPWTRTTDKLDKYSDLAKQLFKAELLIELGWLVESYGTAGGTAVFTWTVDFTNIPEMSGLLGGLSLTQTVVLETGSVARQNSRVLVVRLDDGTNDFRAFLTSAGSGVGEIDVTTTCSVVFTEGAFGGYDTYMYLALRMTGCYP